MCLPAVAPRLRDAGNVILGISHPPRGKGRQNAQIVFLGGTASARPLTDARRTVCSCAQNCYHCHAARRTALLVRAI